MSLSLVVTSEQFRSLRQQEGRLISRCSPAAYAMLPATESLKRHLEIAGIRYGRCDDTFVLFGARAIDFAESFQVPLLPLLADGDPAPGDPLRRQVIAALLDVLLPAPPAHGELCSLALPVFEERPDKNFLAQLIRLRGYTPIPLRSSMALVLAALGADGFTGVGMAFDEDRCEISVAHRGIEVAGASATVESPLTEQLERVVRAASDAWLAAPLALNLPQPVCIVCAGSLPLRPGFAESFARAIHEARFPASVEEICIIDPPAQTIARGCLIHAELETLSRARRSSVA